VLAHGHSRQLAEPAVRIALVGRFDLDHLGAEVGHDGRGGRAGDEAADVQHEDAVERAR
jgi:hypothetical protein